MSITAHVNSVQPSRGKLTAWMPTASDAMVHRQRWISCDTIHSAHQSLSFHFKAREVGADMILWAWMDESKTEQQGETAFRIRAWGCERVVDPENHATVISTDLLDLTCRKVGEVSYTVVWDATPAHTRHFACVSASDIVSVSNYITATNDRLRALHQRLPVGLPKWTNCDEKFFLAYKTSSFRYLPQALFYAHACRHITRRSAEGNKASLQRLVEVAVHRVGEPTTYADWCSLLTETCALLPLSMAYDLDRESDFTKAVKRYTRTTDHHKLHCVDEDENPDQWDHPLCYPACSEMAGDCEDMAAAALTVWKLLTCVEEPVTGPGETHDTFGGLVLLAKALLVMPTICILKDGHNFTYHATLLCADAAFMNSRNCGPFDRLSEEKRFMTEVMGSEAGIPPTNFFIECTAHVNPTVVDTTPYCDIYDKLGGIPDIAQVRIPTFSSHEDTGYYGICTVIGSHVADSAFTEAQCISHRGKPEAWADPRDFLDREAAVTLDGTTRTIALDNAFARISAQLPPLSRLSPPPADRALPDYDRTRQVMATRRQHCHGMNVKDLHCERHKVAILEDVTCYEYIYSTLPPDSD